MRAIYKRELKAYMSHPRGFMFIPLLLLALGILIFKFNIMDGVANISYAFYAHDWASYVIIVLIPLLCMDAFSSERKHQMDRFYFSLPLKTSAVVLGKYLALLTIYAISMGIVCLYPLVVSFMGEVNLLWSYATLVNYFIMGAALMAVCMFISSLTKYTVVSGIVGILASAVLYGAPVLAGRLPINVPVALGGFYILAAVLIVAAWFATKHTLTVIVTAVAAVSLPTIACVLDAFVFKGTFFMELFPSLLSYASPFYHFSFAAVDGVIDLFGIAVTLSYVVLFVFMTVRSLDQRRYA